MNKLKDYIFKFKILNQTELGRLIDNPNKVDDYYYKVGFCRGQLDLIRLIEQIIEEEENNVKH